MTDAPSTRLTIPAPRLTALQGEHRDLLRSAEYVIREAGYQDLVPRGIVEDTRKFSDFKLDFWKWFRKASDLQVDAFWLLVEERHELLKAKEAAEQATARAEASPTPVRTP